MLKKWLSPEIALGFLVATILAAALLGWQSSYAPTEIEKQQCYEQAKKAGHKTEECKSLWEKATSDPVAFFTFVLCVMTAGLVGSTVALWLTTKAAIKTTENTTLAVEGAYVFAGIGGSAVVTVTPVSDDGIQLPYPPDRFVRLSASAVTYGRTAGLISDIEWDICRESRLPPIGAKLIYRRRVHVGWTIPPNQAMELQQTISEVRRINRPHVFYGRIAFTDLLRKKQGYCEFMHRIAVNGSLTPVKGRDASSRTYIED